MLMSSRQPEVHAERPFIVGVDERLDSPDTATLKYEAAVARANGGDVRGVTPPGIVPMAAYAKPAPIHGKFPELPDKAARPLLVSEGIQTRRHN